MALGYVGNSTELNTLTIFFDFIVLLKHRLQIFSCPLTSLSHFKFEHWLEGEEVEVTDGAAAESEVKKDEMVLEVEFKVTDAGLLERDTDAVELAVTGAEKNPTVVVS